MQTPKKTDRHKELDDEYRRLRREGGKEEELLGVKKERRNEMRARTRRRLEYDHRDGKLARTVVD
eukprot:593865-Pyramimonas_sp.AAC.1